MEVHHHPNVEKKRFKEFFLEFIMMCLQYQIRRGTDLIHFLKANMGLGTTKLCCRELIFLNSLDQKMFLLLP